MSLLDLPGDTFGEIFKYIISAALANFYDLIYSNIATIDINKPSIDIFYKIKKLVFLEVKSLSRTCEKGRKVLEEFESGRFNSWFIEECKIIFSSKKCRNKPYKNKPYKNDILKVDGKIFTMIARKFFIYAKIETSIIIINIANIFFNKEMVNAAEFFKINFISTFISLARSDFYEPIKNGIGCICQCNIDNFSFNITFYDFLFSFTDMKFAKKLYYYEESKSAEIIKILRDISSQNSYFAPVFAFIFCNFPLLKFIKNNDKYVSIAENIFSSAGLISKI